MKTGLKFNKKYQEIIQVELNRLRSINIESQSMIDGVKKMAPNIQTKQNKNMCLNVKEPIKIHFKNENQKSPYFCFCLKRALFKRKVRVVPKKCPQRFKRLSTGFYVDADFCLCFPCLLPNAPTRNERHVYDEFGSNDIIHKTQLSVYMHLHNGININTGSI